MKTGMMVSGMIIAALANALDANEPACCAIETPAPVKTASCCAAAPAEPEVAPLSDRSVYQLGATWTNDANEPVTLASLRGRPVLLTMFFASCSYACPILVEDLRRIREGLPPEIRETAQLVLVSFDSERDTPAALRAFRERMRLDAANWVLLHGQPDDVQELAMLLGVKYKKDARGEYAHSNLITVLNADGEIVHQKNGLQGEVAGAIRAVTLAAR